jgi:hypothetical protein
MIGENLAGPPFLAYAWSHEAEPSVRDLGLKIAMVPGVITRLREAAWDRRAW